MEKIKKEFYIESTEIAKMSEKEVREAKKDLKFYDND